MDNLDIINDIWDYSDPKVSRDKFKAYLNQNSVESDLEMEIRTQLIRTYTLEGEFDDAFRLCDKLEPLLDKNSTSFLRLILEKGRAFNSSKQRDQALIYFRQAELLGKKLREDFLVIDAIHMIAIADPKNSLELNLKAIEFAKMSNDSRAQGWLGSLLNNTGWSFHDKGEFEQACELFDQALDFFTENKQEKRRRIAKWTVGRCLRSLGKVDEALNIQQELLEEYNELGEQDGYCHEEIGELMLMKDRTGLAKNHFSKAYELLSKETGIKKERLDRIKSLSV